VHDAGGVAEQHGPVRLRGDRQLPVTQLQLAGVAFEHHRGRALEGLGHPVGGHHGGTRRQRREAAGVAARGHRPRRRLRVHLDDGVHVVGRQAQPLGDDLADDRAVSLALGRRAEHHRHLTAGVD
jgi:hypothetical protein